MAEFSIIFKYFCYFINYLSILFAIFINLSYDINPFNHTVTLPLHVAVTHALCLVFQHCHNHNSLRCTSHYAAYSQAANYTPPSQQQQVTTANCRIASSVYIRDKAVSASRWVSIFLDNLPKSTGALMSKYIQSTQQQTNFSHAPAHLSESSQQTIAEGQRALTLAGCALLVVVGYVFYRRQQRTIQLLIKQKAELASHIRHLELIDDKKISLFSLISHDLRLPVIRLKQQLHTLRQASPATAPISQQIQESEEQVDQLARMLTNLLDWSVVQTKKLPTNPKPVNLAGITAEVVADASTELKRKEIRLINQISESTWIIADRYQLLCVIRNLISNAIKFTSPHGYIRLYTKTTDEGVYTSLTVQDTGIGMNAEQLMRLLSDPVIRSGTEGEPGTGLGLQLCRELLGGTSDALQIVSRPGKGTSVTIRLIVSEKPVC